MRNVKKWKKAVAAYGEKTFLIFTADLGSL